MSDTYCTDCKRNTEVVFDHAAGDTVCSECGLVLESRSIDESSEWRTFADDSGDHDPNRVGGPVNPFLADAALSTVISRGANGSNADSSLARLQNRGGDPDRAIVLAFKTISSMADRLSLVTTIKVRVQILGKDEVPLVEETISLIQAEEFSHSVQRNEKEGKLKVVAGDNMKDLWCSYCRRSGHIKYKCWKLLADHMKGTNEEDI